jgi:molybdate transport system substrate-binding protein
MPRFVPARVAVLAVVAVLTAGCGSSPSTPKSTAPSTSPSSPAPGSAPAALTGSITVFAAASLTQTFTDLGKQFEAAHPGTSVRFSFGASSTLAQQILAGAPADGFAAASPTNMQQVTDAGAAAGPTTFAKNYAEIAVAPAGAGKVASIDDLSKPGVKVALCQPQVPCGALAQTVLAKAKVSVAPVTQGLDVKSTLAYVTGGEADAAVVYVTDVKAAGAQVKAVEIPAADNASTAYPIATVKNSQNAALAAAFEDLVLSAAGQSVLSGAGFQRP